MWEKNTPSLEPFFLLTLCRLPWEVKCLKMTTGNHKWKRHHYLRVAEEREKNVGPR